MPTQPRRAGRRLRRLAIVLVLLVLLSEVGLRLLGLGNPLLYQPDSAAGYVVTPGWHCYRYFCTNRVNRFSMRSDEIDEHKPAGSTRLLVIGDSFTYGTTYVDQKDLFTTLLAHRLTDRLGHKVEVLNASAGGWAVGNELGYLRSRGTFEADDICIVINDGDLTQPFNLLPTPFPKKPWFAWEELFTRFVLPRFTGKSTADAGTNAAAILSVAQEEPKMLAQLKQANDYSKAHGAGFFVVYIPSAYRPTQAITDSETQGHEMLVAWAQSNGIPLIDMRAAWVGHPADELFFDHGAGHPRPKVHAMVAEAIDSHWSEIVAKTQSAASTQPAPSH